MKTSFTRIFLFLVCGFTFAGCCATRPVVSHPELELRSPTILPNVTRSMQTPGFWTSRHPYPDTIILTKDEIASLNTKSKEQHLTANVLGLGPTMPSRTLRAEINETLQQFYSKKYFLNDGKVADTAFLDSLKHNMLLDGMAEALPVRFGFIVHYADQRLLPTDEALLEKPGDLDFDQLQNSALDVGSVVAILHESRDGKWFYVQGDSVPGWIKKEFVAIASLDQVKEWEASQAFLVTTAAKTDIFLDEYLAEHYDYVQMGTWFPIEGEEVSGIIKIKLPLRQADGTLAKRIGFLQYSDVHVGYLSYTPRQVIIQAFKLLNAPYGWGGMYGEQDCSRFLQEIFSTFGIQLPRNSGEQIKVGKEFARFDAATTSMDKMKVLNAEGVGGITILGMRGHIMLFLGLVGNRPYAIHATWAFREQQAGNQVARIMNKVVVSDLSLGEGSHKGSLLERLRTITILKNERKP